MKSEINVYMPNHCIINVKNVSKKKKRNYKYCIYIPKYYILKKIVSWLSYRHKYLYVN